jgi:copper chaperone CopZ
MKSLKRTSIVFSFILFTLSLMAGNGIKKKVETTEFKVSGVCEMCEKRIENAALVKGVKMAVWNKETQKIKVIYSPEKTDEESIHQAIAAAGHDTGKVKATTEAYRKLHDCCKYREGQKAH